MKRKILSGDHFFQCIVNIILFLFMCIELYPLLYVLSCSLSEPEAVSAGQILLFPVGFNLGGFEKILKYKDVWIGYGNTILYTVIGTIVSLFVTLTCAYTLSRRDVVGRKVLTVYFMITMYLSGGLVPGYLNVKSLGLVNTRTYIFIYSALSVYNLLVARTFFASSIPPALDEAARIEGCDDLRVFTKIIIPLSKPVITVMTLYYAVPRWNSYFTEMIYLKDRWKYPLQSFLKEILLESKMAKTAASTAGMLPEEVKYYKDIAKQAELMKYCVIVVATVPMLLVYPKLQKYFEKGIMLGSVKE